MMPLEGMLAAVLVACCLPLGAQGGTNTSGGRMDSLLSLFSQQELECLSDKQVLFRGQCRHLLTTGPCNTNEWLVLDKESSNRGTERPVVICKRCDCCTRNQQIFWPADRRCHDLSRDKRRMCPLAGTEPKNDLFGEGECTCLTDPPHTRLFSNRQGACYELYHRGPCGEREVVLPKPDDPEVGVCGTNQCYDFNRRFNRHFAPDDQGVCHQLGTIGPCVDSETFKVSTLTHRPECVTSALTAFVVDNRCHVDPNTTECVKAVRYEKQVQRLSASALIAHHCKQQKKKKIKSAACKGKS